MTVTRAGYEREPGPADGDQPLAIAGVMIIGCLLIAIFYFFFIRRRAALRMRRIPTRRGQG